MGCPLGRMTPVDVQGGAYLLVDLASARRDDQPRRARLDGVVERCRAAVEHVNVLSRLRLVRTEGWQHRGCLCLRPPLVRAVDRDTHLSLSLIHISEPTRL